MTELKIVKYPHPALRFELKPLQAIDKEVRLIAGQMLELMYGARGLGRTRDGGRRGRSAGRTRCVAG